MAHKVILPPQKNYIKKFLKQRDIGIFIYQSAVVYCCCVLLSVVGCSCVWFVARALPPPPPHHYMYSQVYKGACCWGGATVT